MIHKHTKSPFALMLTMLLFVGLLTGCSEPSTETARNNSSSSPVKISDTNHSKTTVNQLSKSKSKQNNYHSILTKLISYTDQESAGPTQNYYWVNGQAKLTGFKHLKAGDYRFAADSHGRATTARAVLTYNEYRNSQGGRQGTPLEPAMWPTNKIVAISYSLTGRTYHGYLYNRSHSIADSLLGEKSYTSANNFTTGTRPQNVGADQNGGMRYAEELAENYWKEHPNTDQTIDYETTPLYYNDEPIPRGSVVEIKSSDNVLNSEVVVLNSVEGIKINYNDGSDNAPIYQKSSNANTSKKEETTSRTASSNDNTNNQAASVTNSTPAQDGEWTVAEAGKVYVSESKKYYSRVTNPQNYTYETVAAAQATGATKASRGNQYARP